jgi:hypothetical protein
MAYVGVDKNGSEWIFEYKPIRDEDGDSAWQADIGDYFALPKGSIAKLIGRELTWGDEPVELVETKGKE